MIRWLFILCFFIFWTIVHGEETNAAGTRKGFTDNFSNNAEEGGETLKKEEEEEKESTGNGTHSPLPAVGAGLADPKVRSLAGAAPNVEDAAVASSAVATTTTAAGAVEPGEAKKLVPRRGIQRPARLRNKMMTRRYSHNVDVPRVVSGAKLKSND